MSDTTNSQGQGNNPQSQEVAVPNLNDMFNGGGINGAPPVDQSQQGQQQGDQGQPQGYSLDAQGFGAPPQAPETPEATPPAGEQAPKEEQPKDSPIDEGYSFLSGDGTGLTQEDLTARNSILGFFGASHMAPTGDLVDANGTVVLTKSQLDDYSATGNVPLDEQGNQIKADGTILRKAEDIQPNFIDATRQLIEAEMPIQLLDKEGKPKVYADSVEGNAEYVKDVYMQGELNAVTTFLNGNPLIKDLYFHVANGNDPETYNFKPVDYASIDVSTLDKEAKLNLIKTSLERQKVSNSNSLMNTISLASDEVITTNAAEAALALKALEADAVAQREADYNAQLAKEKEANEKYWKEINSAITNDTIQNIKIPATEKEDFFKYLSMPIDSKGASQVMIDEEAEALDFKLMVDYLRYKKYNLNDLVELRAKTSKVNSLRERARQIPNPKVISSSTPTPANPNGAPDININMLTQAERRQ